MKQKPTLSIEIKIMYMSDNYPFIEVHLLFSRQLVTLAKTKVIPTQMTKFYSYLITVNPSIILRYPAGVLDKEAKCIKGKDNRLCKQSLLLRFQ